MTEGMLKPGETWPPKPTDPLYRLYQRGHIRMPTVDMSNEIVVERLRRLMIRHTKAMRMYVPSTPWPLAASRDGL